MTNALKIPLKMGSQIFIDTQYRENALATVTKIHSKDHIEVEINNAPGKHIMHIGVNDIKRIKS